MDLQTHNPKILLAVAKQIIIQHLETLSCLYCDYDFLCGHKQMLEKELVPVRCMWCFIQVLSHLQPSGDFLDTQLLLWQGLLHVCLLTASLHLFSAWLLYWDTTPYELWETAVSEQLTVHCTNQIRIAWRLLYVSRRVAMAQFRFKAGRHSVSSEA